MSEAERRERVDAWRQAEDRFYASVLTMPEAYASGIRLVRALANRLDDVRDVEALLDAYRDTDVDDVAEVAEELELSHRHFVDYELALDAAFYLRYQEVLEEQAEGDIRTRLTQARSEGEEWVVLYDNETRQRGHTFFQRLEMHLPDGIGLYTASELDWEKGRVYVVEPIVLDPDTGRPHRGVPPPEPRQEFETREELAAAVAAMREKYSRDDTSTEDDAAEDSS